MRIEKQIKNYIVFSGDSILDTLKRINKNRSRIAFVVEDNGVLIGSISDGDFRRWITKSENFDLTIPVDNIMNRDYVSKLVGEKPGTIEAAFQKRFDIIPLTDEQGRFVALARKSEQGFQIGKHLIAENRPAFIIAEIGNNHNGDVDLAKLLVDKAKEAGADCVKFQMRDMGSLYNEKHVSGQTSQDLGSEYTLDLLNRFQLSNDEMCHVFDYCYSQNILPLCTPWDLSSLKCLEAYGMEAYKIASADLTNHELLEAVSATGKPFISSTGMSTEPEIKDAVSLLRSLNAQFALLHCNSTYPTPFKDVNLNYLPRLKAISETIVGYSGHERGIEVPVAAVALGAKIIEKHFTIDRDMEGNDHKVSLLPDEFADMVRMIRNVEKSLGQTNARVMSQGELINRETLAKSVYVNCQLSSGDVILQSMLEIRSPGQGLQPNRISELIGQVARRDMLPGDVFFDSDIDSRTEKRAEYRFNRPFGIPVRHHDFDEITRDVDLDFVEFHLSYNDLNLSSDQFLAPDQRMELAVHSPELFAGDHLLDLAHNDINYRTHSAAQLRRVIEFCDSLKVHFPKTDKPVLVVNAGGWDTEGFITAEQREQKYQHVEQSLAQMDLSGVVLAIQTMPPFPWHFGGQSFHNLFVNPDEIALFCEKTGHRICLDVSHSVMACNYYKWDFRVFLTKVLPYTVHLHISDAKGEDGEGVQIGHGDVDFPMLAKLLTEMAVDVPFIPEVWQGHKNAGEGFWHALTVLEKFEF